MCALADLWPDEGFICGSTNVVPPIPDVAAVALHNAQHSDLWGLPRDLDSALCRATNRRLVQPSGPQREAEYASSARLALNAYFSTQPCHNPPNYG